MSAPSTESRYAALREVIERELAAIPARDFSAIAALKRERAAIIRSLPATPPPEARSTLVQCLALQGQIADELHTVRAAILRDLDQVHRARRTASGYAAARGPVRRISAAA